MQQLALVRWLLAAAPVVVVAEEVAIPVSNRRCCGYYRTDAARGRHLHLLLVVMKVAASCAERDDALTAAKASTAQLAATTVRRLRQARNYVACTSPPNTTPLTVPHRCTA